MEWLNYENCTGRPLHSLATSSISGPFSPEVVSSILSWNAGSDSSKSVRSFDRTKATPSPNCRYSKHQHALEIKARLTDIAEHRARPMEEPLDQAGNSIDLAPASNAKLVEALFLFNAESEVDDEVVIKILANSWEVVKYGNALGLQMLRGTDTTVTFKT